jgi:hypothetical protein
MMRAICACDSCQAAAKALGALPDALPIADSDGGTAVLLYRKDRVGQVEGAAHLRTYRLEPDSPTRRLVADCCNTPMLMDFTKGYWLSIYPVALPSGDPAARPSVRTFTAPFMARLLLTWAGMGFRTPKLGW